MAGLETSIHQDAGGYSLVCRETNVVGKPYEGKPYVRFDVAGNNTDESKIVSPKKIAPLIFTDIHDRKKEGIEY